MCLQCLYVSCYYLLTSGSLAQLNDLRGCDGFGAFLFGCLLNPKNPPSALPPEPGGGGGANNSTINKRKIKYQVTHMICEQNHGL